MMRHLIWMRLTRIGFKLKHFMTPSGKYIYTVIFTEENNLRIMAE
jgi:hypothetical protein